MRRLAKWAGGVVQCRGSFVGIKIRGPGTPGSVGEGGREGRKVVPVMAGTDLAGSFGGVAGCAIALQSSVQR